MHIVIFRILWPYILRILAKYGADYLQKRRDRRLKIGETEQLRLAPESAPASEAMAMECPPCPPCPEGISASDVFWFTMSGVLLGSALGVILVYLIRPETSQATEMDSEIS